MRRLVTTYRFVLESYVYHTRIRVAFAIRKQIYSWRSSAYTQVVQSLYVDTDNPRISNEH